MFVRALLVAMLIAGSAFAVSGPRGKLVKSDQVQYGTNTLDTVLDGINAGAIATSNAVTQTQLAIAQGTVNTALTVVAQDFLNLESYLLGGDQLVYGIVPNVETQFVGGVGYIITNYVIAVSQTNEWSSNGAATNAALVPALQYNQNITQTNFALVNTNTYVTTNLFNLVGQALGLSGTNLVAFNDWISAYQQMDLGYTQLPTNLVFNFPSITEALDIAVSNIQVNVETVSNTLMVATNTLNDVETEVGNVKDTVVFGNLQGAQVQYVNSSSVEVKPLAGFVMTNFFTLTNETYSLVNVAASEHQEYLYIHEDSPYPVGLVTNSTTQPTLDLTYGGYYASGIGRAFGCVNINASGDIESFFSTRDGWMTYVNGSGQADLFAEGAFTENMSQWIPPSNEPGTNFFSVAATEARMLAFLKQSAGDVDTSYSLWFGAIEGNTTNFVAAAQTVSDDAGAMFLSVSTTIPLGPSNYIGFQFRADGTNRPGARFIRTDGFKEVW